MTNIQEHVLVVISDAQVTILLDRVLRSSGYEVTVFHEGAPALEQCARKLPSLVILGEKLNDGQGIDFAAEFARRFPMVPGILFVYQDTPDLLKRAMRLGIADYLVPPLRSEEILRSVKNALDIARRRREQVLLEPRRYTSALKHQVDELEMLTRLGREVTGLLDLDGVLAAIIDAAVELTGAEEGSLLLIDDVTGELYMRAARNFQEDFVRTFRLPITDSLAGSVIRSGETVLIDENTPQKIKTAYLVQSLAYVPLQVKGRVFGVLGVDNRHSHLPLTQRHVKMLNALAGYAVIAIENARLYNNELSERNKLEAILTGVQDGVVVIDQDHRLALVNDAVRVAFNLGQDTNMSSKQFSDVFDQQELLELTSGTSASRSNRTELSPDENHIYSVQVTPIPDVGQVVTMHDITNLKKLDRIKTDFVHTVSHDLRSPLTAILGYVELIERAGPVTDLQRDFIHRVQVSVHNITHLVDDLLDLGRIESGFDVRKENILIDQIIHFSAESLKNQLAEKGHHLQIDLPKDFPIILANPVQIRQMIDNLMENSIKYTPPGGTVSVHSEVEQNQIILQFMDTGIGIPSMDLPYIFDKFYRASNASMESSGSGLGLSIVKSIVENHGGRIWVDSTVAKGSTFTVVLPFIQ